ncbi:hypothetical protein C0J52_22189 [Blattella germanica]|nr:hypothetical protein C0J52_22189 [Blattella germanica]
MLRFIRCVTRYTSEYVNVCVPAQYTPIRHLSLRSLLPDTQHYMTYEGSTTHPGCWETTVWIILNKPIYITKQEVGKCVGFYGTSNLFILMFQLYALRKLMQGSEQTPKAPLGNNARPLQPLHHRTVRTNIDFKKEEVRIATAAPIIINMHFAGACKSSYLYSLFCSII